MGICDLLEGYLWVMNVYRIDRVGFVVVLVLIFFRVLGYILGEFRFMVFSFIWNIFCVFFELYWNIFFCGFEGVGRFKVVFDSVLVRYMYLFFL